MRLCFVGGGLKGGGQERTLTDLANYVISQGHKAEIINLFRTEQFYTISSDIFIKWPDLERDKYNRFIYALKILPYLRRNIQLFKPDVVISFGEWFNPYTVISTRFLGVPVYLYDLMGPSMRLDPLIQLSRRALYRFADGIIVQTKVAGEIVQQSIGAKMIKVIPNPLNPINAENCSKQNHIVSLGRLSKEKGHIHLLRAFSMIKKKDWSLVIIGDGPERSSLQWIAHQLKVNERVKFYGHLRDFASLLGQAEIFVLPSLHEGFPNALLEAMSIPLACISSDCVAGPGDIIQHGVNGILVNPGDEKELAEAIDLLIMNPDLRQSLAQEAYKVREKYNFDIIARELLNFILPEKSN